MAIFGLLLILCATALAVEMVLQNTSSISVEAVGQSLSLSPGWLFVAGVATGAIGLLGASMVVAGMARARRRRAAVVESRSSVQDLQAEHDRLVGELERERAGRTSATPGPRQHERQAVPDDDAPMVDLADERRAEPRSAEAAAVPGAAGREPADRREPVESGRHGLFHRRR